MPLYTFTCPKGHETGMIVAVEMRDSISPLCDTCHKPAKRVHCEGQGLLFYEEGRARFDQGLGGPPITSPGDRARRMRLQGVSEGNGVVPNNIKRDPKSPAMQRYLSKDRGKWL